MKFNIPLLLMPQKQALAFAHPFLSISTRVLKKKNFIEKDLYKLDTGISAVSYLSIAMLSSLIYAAMALALSFLVLNKTGVGSPAELALAAGLAAGALVFFFTLAYPRWMMKKRVAEIDRDLLYAARHLRIQTTAGAPLFDSIVSASHGYGAISEEFEKIISSVQAGVSLADALEESALRNPSYYYNRILWQMSNAVKAGTDIGPVLSEIVEFLADEQRIQMRNYGAQLNTLAIMYLLACIIVPTISLIFLMVISSFVDIPITDTVFAMILGALIFVQYMFIGLIESRRPAVSI